MEQIIEFSYHFFLSFHDSFEEGYKYVKFILKNYFITRYY